MKKQQITEITIDQIRVGVADVWLKGISPLIYNAMSDKARRTLLLPAGKKTAADRAQTLKHDPITEYRDSAYQRVGDGATRLTMPCTAIKSALASAAIEVPGMKKAQIGRLTWVAGDTVDVYGVPQMLMSVVRMADISRTPDIRTRAILPEWCLKVSIRYVMPTLNEVTIARLLETAGLVIGLGDFRPEKGKGNYGQFQIADPKEVEAIIKAGGLKAQDKALEKPAHYDLETQKLYEWYASERKRRGV